MAERAPVLVGGIDPGYSSGGLVLLDAQTDVAVAARRYGAAPAGRAEVANGNPEFTRAAAHAAARAAAIADDLRELALVHGRPVAVAIEAFVDQPSRAKKLVKDRWKTPLVIGHLAVLLAADGYSVGEGNLLFPDAGVIARQFHEQIGELSVVSSGSAHPYDPQKLLRNGHQRDSWAIGAWLALRVRTGALADARPSAA